MSVRSVIVNWLLGCPKANAALHAQAAAEVAALQSRVAAAEGFSVNEASARWGQGEALARRISNLESRVTRIASWRVKGRAEKSSTDAVVATVTARD